MMKEEIRQEESESGASYIPRGSGIGPYTSGYTKIIDYYSR